MSDGKMVMNKLDVIRIMTNAVEESARNKAKIDNVPSEEFEAYAARVRPEADFVHSIIYDELVSRGIIKEN
jgi:hypothetical protein